MVQKLILLFILLTLLCMVLFNKEHFNVNCYPNSTRHKPLNSYKSLSKGWCTTGFYDNVDIPDKFDHTVYGKSKLKCDPDNGRLSPIDAIQTDGKGMCR